MTVLTGLELNLFERAGYIVRRGAVNPDSAPDAPPDVLTRIFRDLLGEHVEERRLTPPSATAWVRLGGLRFEAGAEALARQQESVCALICRASDAGLCVLPASQLAPLAPADAEIIQRNPGDELPDQVCLRMSPGDAVVMSAGLLLLPLRDLSEVMAGWNAQRVRKAVAGEAGN